MAENSTAEIVGTLTWELRDAEGNLKEHGQNTNKITDVGDLLYASRGAGLTTSALPTGVKLGSSTTAASKNGAGAALVTYTSGTQHAFDGGFPTATSNAGAGAVATYKATYIAGEGTTASAINEAVIVTDALANATSTAANTAARIILSPAPTSKAATDTLTLTWTHTILGA